MKKEVYSEIVSILDEDATMIVRREKLRTLIAHRRGVNRRTITVIHDILRIYTLPIRHDQELHGAIIKSIPDDVYENIKTIWLKSNNTYFSAVAGELLWIHYHDKIFIDQALGAYLSEIDSPSYAEDMYFLKIAISICRILKRYNPADIDFSYFFECCERYICENSTASGYNSLFLLLGLLDCRLMTQRVEELYLSIIDDFRKEENYVKAIAYEESWENYCKQSKKATLDIQLKLAEDYEHNADQYDWNRPADAHIIINLIQKAMNVWSRINNAETKEQRKRLAKKIDGIKQLIIKSGQRITSDPIDISDYVTLLNDIIQSSSLEAYLWELSNIVPIVDGAKIEEQRANFESSIADFFETVLFDKDGRKVCIIPSAQTQDPVKKQNRQFFDAKKHYEFHTRLSVSRFLHLAQDTLCFSKDTLRFLVENNVFIPPDRKDSFLSGLVAGFSFDFCTALHILMPQVENAIRVLAETCGGVVYKTNPDGTEECLSMTSILNLPEIKNTLDEEFLFNLQLFYTSVYGFGMRDVVAHSLDSDQELGSIQGMAVWWYTFHLCCIYCPELYRRVKSKR